MKRFCGLLIEKCKFKHELYSHSIKNVNELTFFWCEIQRNIENKVHTLVVTGNNTYVWANLIQSSLKETKANVNHTTIQVEAYIIIELASQYASNSRSL